MISLHIQVRKKKGDIDRNSDTHFLEFKGHIMTKQVRMIKEGKQ